jgi:phospholipase C
MDRRRFLRNSALGLGAVAVGPALSRLFGGTTAEAEASHPFLGGSMLDEPAREARIDHVVVLMMENRSFDHFLGWLASDDDFLENGRRRYGELFRVHGTQDKSYLDANGVRARTHYLADEAGQINPYRGCGHPDPGHGWDSGRVQRDLGFLADGSGNDHFALGYYRSRDVPLYASLARRFTVFDRYHSSLMGPTFPNREYLHGAQSGGNKGNQIPVEEGGFQWDTIWDRLSSAGVPARYYSVDLPTVALWGPRMRPLHHHVADYFSDCANGTLPNVTFVDPGFTTALRTDDHPFADIRSGQKYVSDLVTAFVNSKHWEHGVFFITYDEWGGFFDHVAPPMLPDVRASQDDTENFAQAGFRVPTLMLSPYAPIGFVDPRTYDHTSILRFIEWRFLGAPAEGPGGQRWWLTKRDRTANNIGRALRAYITEADVELPVVNAVPPAAPACAPDDRDGDGLQDLSNVEKHVFELAMESGFFERMGFRIDLQQLPSL